MAKSVKETKQQFTVMIKPSTVKELDKIAEHLGQTRSQLVSNLIEMGLEDMKVLEKTGLFKAVIFGDKIMRKFKEALLSGKVSLDKNGEIEVRKDAL
jgi:metal-responsive CopG/Arc/MetJ family transcriptional regulator